MSRHRTRIVARGTQCGTAGPHDGREFSHQKEGNSEAVAYLLDCQGCRVTSMAVKGALPRRHLGRDAGFPGS